MRRSPRSGCPEASIGQIIIVWWSECPHIIISMFCGARSEGQLLQHCANKESAAHFSLDLLELSKILSLLRKTLELSKA